MHSGLRYWRPASQCCGSGCTSPARGPCPSFAVLDLNFIFSWHTKPRRISCKILLKATVIRVSSFNKQPGFFLLVCGDYSSWPAVAFICKYDHFRFSFNDLLSTFAISFTQHTFLSFQCLLHLSRTNYILPNMV